MSLGGKTNSTSATIRKGVTDLVKPEDTPTGRFYPWKKEKFVSVTTVIGEGIPKPGLSKWFLKRTIEIAADKRKELALLTKVEAIQTLTTADLFGGNDAAMLGSRVHAMCEKLVKGKEILPSTQEKEYVDNFRQFMVDYSPEYEETESTVFSRTHGYAGTLDAIAVIGGKRYVIDIKTGKGVWPEAALQMSAYRYADFLGRSGGREDRMPDIDGGLVLHIRPDRYEVIPVDTGPATFDTFLSALDVYRWNKIEGREAIGEAWKRSES